MLTVYNCITVEHDLRLVVLAGFICMFATFSATHLLLRSTEEGEQRRSIWILGAGTVAGCGIWATHFIAMLAFQPETPVSYDPGITFLSFVIAIVFASIGFAVSTRFRPAGIGGATIGLAIGAMQPCRHVGHQRARITSPGTGISSPHRIVIGTLSPPRPRGGLLAEGPVAHSRLLDTRNDRDLRPAFHRHGGHVHCRRSERRDRGQRRRFPCARHRRRRRDASDRCPRLSPGIAVDRHLADRTVKEARRLRAHVLELEETKKKLEATSADLMVALKTASAADHAKSQFLATMSHELRTPLNAILGFSEIMTAETFGPLGNPRYKDYSQDIYRSGKHLLALINDVLDFTRADAGELHIHEEDVDIEEVAADAIRMIEAQATTQKIEIRTEFASPCPISAPITAACGRCCSTSSRTRSSSQTEGHVHGRGGGRTRGVRAAGRRYGYRHREAGHSAGAGALRADRFRPVEEIRGHRARPAALALPDGTSWRHARHRKRAGPGHHGHADLPHAAGSSPCRTPPAPPPERAFPKDRNSPRESAIRRYHG